MDIRALSKVIYNPGTASMNRPITVKHYSRGIILWKGLAKDLGDANLDDYSVIEILVDNDPKFSEIHPINKGRIITVV